MMKERLLNYFKGLTNKYEKFSQDTKEYYLVKMRFDGTNYITNYIIEKKLLAIMLEQEINPNSVLISALYGHIVGWHVGNDTNIYQKIDLNGYGEKYYDYLHPNDCKKVFDAFTVMNNRETETNNYSDEIAKLQTYFKKEGIKSITPYTAKELAKPLVETNIK